MSNEVFFNAAETLEDDSSVSEAPRYPLFPVRTVADAWREWEVGIFGRPPLKALERRWGAKLRPTAAQRVAWCRRKVIIDEVERLMRAGRSGEAAVAELEALRAGRTLPKLIDVLSRRRHQQKSIEKV